MDYSPLDIELIRIFGKKELSDGCLLYLQDKDKYHTFNSSLDTVEEDGIYRELPGVLSYTLIFPTYQIVGVRPTIEDIFRVSGEKQMYVDIDSQFEGINFYKINFCKEDETIAYTKYNPTIPLLQQSDDVKKVLVEIFK